jgi:hypothetical protein
MGCSLLHLTFEAAHESHEARSLGLRSREDLGADVGDRRGEAGAVGWVMVSGACHSGVCDLKSMIFKKSVLVPDCLRVGFVS